MSSIGTGDPAAIPVLICVLSEGHIYSRENEPEPA
jgi:hypothetical protein